MTAPRPGCGHASGRSGATVAFTNVGFSRRVLVTGRGATDENRGFRRRRPHGGVTVTSTGWNQRITGGRSA